MNILFCDNSLKELLNFRGDVINHFASLNHNIVLVSPENYQDQDNKYQFLDNVKFIPVDIDANGTNPINDLKYFIRLLKIYKKEKPDYIFHYTIKPNIYGTLGAKLLGIKSSAMIAGLGSCFSNNSLGNKLARKLYKRALKYSDKVLVLNESNRDFLTQNGFVDPNKIILLSGGEGVNLDKFK